MAPRIARSPEGQLHSLLRHHSPEPALGDCPHCRGRERGKANVAIACLLTAVLVAVFTGILTAHVYPRCSPGHSDPSLRHYCIGLARWMLGLRASKSPANTTAAPANHVVEYVSKKFNRSRGQDKTLFQGWPTDQIDRTWAESYTPGIISTIDASTALKLPEETQRLPLSGREDEYIITIDAFHQMHCLDVVRMALYHDRYDKSFYHPNGTVDYCKWLHVDHCLDQVRQALMCHADVSVVYYAWSNITQGMRPRVDNVHTCRNYTKILEWASQRGVAPHDWHPSRRVVEGPDGELVIKHGRNYALNGEGECNAI